MTGEYEIKLGEKAIGCARVYREGLYYRFQCRCRLSGTVMHKIVVDCGGEQRSLGIPAPVGGEFELDTRVPSKYFQQAKPAFYALPRHQDLNGKFVPVYPEEPFAYLARLKGAYLTRRDGQIGVVLK